MTTQHTPNKTNLSLCLEHKQEWKQSHYAEHNCDHCKLEKRLRDAEQQSDELLQVAIKVKADLRRMGFQNSTLNDAIAKAQGVV